jgi:hypothetical protein
MKTLDVQGSLEYACAAVAVYRALAIENRKMTFGNFAKAIGFMSQNERWKPGLHSRQIGTILDLIAAAQNLTGPDPHLGEFSSERFLENTRGKPGTGARKTVRVVAEPR